MTYTKENTAGNRQVGKNAGRTEHVLELLGTLFSYSFSRRNAIGKILYLKL